MAEHIGAEVGGGSNLTKSHEGEHHGDFGNTPVAITKATKLYSFCAAVNSCNLGYDIGVSTNVGPLLKSTMNLSDSQLELFVGSINFWSMFGAISAQYFSDMYGRRRTFVVAAVSFIAGCVVMALAPTYSILMAGRAFVGLGVGVGLAIDPLYIAEISPAKYRGYLVTWSEFALNIGIVFGFSTGLTLGKLADATQWRVMFLMGCIMPLIMIFLVRFIMPESPRWLVSKNNEPEAKIVLQSVYPEGFNVDLVIEDIKESMERERLATNNIGWGTILNPTPAFKRMLIIGVGIAIAQQAVGIDAIQYYLLFVINESGVKDKNTQLLILMALGLIKLAFIMVGGKLFDIKGRRPLLFISLAGCSLSLFIISLAFFIDPAGKKYTFTIIGLAMYLAFFSIGIGPGAWLIPSEIFATCIRAKAMSLATFLNRVTGTIYASTFLTMQGLLDWAGLFLALSIICALVLAFLAMYYPETKGRSLEDMSIYFAEVTGDNSILEAEQRIRDGTASEMEISTVQSGGILPPPKKDKGGTMT